MVSQSRRSDAGNMLVNAMIWIAITALVLAVALPAADRIREDRDASVILDEIEIIEKACRRHHADTGKYAIEFSPSRTGQYSGPRYHQLSLRQDSASWRGPYLDRPLSRARNPFGGAIYLQNDLGATPAEGFHLRGPRAPRREGPGQFLVFYGVPEDTAIAIDQRLDQKLSEEHPEHWRDCGRVEWRSTGQGALIVYLSLDQAREISDD